jgi:predicted dehydrogenase
MLRGGVIGLGRMGVTHFSIINTHPSVNMVAVCDQSKNMLNFFDKHVKVATFSNQEEMFKESKLDFVIISTPTDSHAEMINLAVANNCHIFVEKPFSMNIGQGDEILNLIEGKELVNQVGYVNRFNEVFMKVKFLLDDGLIGEIKHFKFEMLGSTVVKDSKSSWRGKKNLGGGCMYEFAAHCIDLIIYLLGNPDKIACSALQSIFSSQVEDLVSSSFVYDTGCMGTMLVNWSDITCRKPVNRLEIYGKKGKILADKHAFKVFLKDNEPTHGFHKGWNTNYITDFADNVHFYVRGNEFSSQLNYFIECIQGEHPGENISSFAEAYKTDIVMDKIFKNSLVLASHG